MKPLFYRKHRTQKQEDMDKDSQKPLQNITVRRYKSPFYDCNTLIHEDIGSMAGVAIDEMNNLLEIGKVEQGGNKVKPLIYAINKNQWGEIALDEEEFKKILNEVYDAGYEDGKAQATRIYLSTPPIEPTPIPLSDPPYWDWTKKQPEITCNNTNDTSKENFDNGQNTNV